MKVMSRACLILVLAHLLSCATNVPLPLDLRGVMGGKTESIPKGKGNLAGDLYVSEDFQRSTAVIYIIANDVKYYATGDFKLTQHFLIENVPRGKWPIVVQIERTLRNTRKRVRFQGTITIGSQDTIKEAVYIPSMPIVLKGQA